MRKHSQTVTYSFLVLSLILFLQVRISAQSLRFVIQKGHNDAIAMIDKALSAGYLASVSFDRTIKLLDYNNKLMIREFVGFNSDINAIKFHPFDYRLAVALNDKSLTEYSTITGAPVRSVKGAKSEISKLVYTQSGKQLIIGFYDGTCGIVNEKEDTISVRLQGQNARVSALAVSDDKNYLVVGYANGAVSIYDLSTHKLLISKVLPDGEISSLFYDNLHNQIILTAYNGMVKSLVYNGVTLDELIEFEAHKLMILSADYDAKSQKLITASFDNTMKLIDMNEGREIQTMKEHTFIVSDVRFINGISSCISSSYDKTLKIWNIANNSTMGTLSPFEGCTTIGLVNYDLDKIVAFDRGNNISIVNSKTNSVISKRYRGGVISSATFVGKSSIIALATEDSTLELINIDDFTKGNISKKTNYRVLSCFYDNGSKAIIAPCTDSTIRYFDASSLQVISESKTKGCLVLSLVSSANGEFLFAACKDNKIREYAAKTMELVATFEGHEYLVSGLALSNDNKVLFSIGNDKNLNLWNTSTLFNFKTFTDNSKPLTTVSLNKANSIVATGSDDGKLNIYDIKQKKRIATIKSSFGGGIVSMAFMNDSNKLLLFYDTGEISLINCDDLQKVELFTLVKVNSDTYFLPDFEGSMKFIGTEVSTVKIFNEASFKEVQVSIPKLTGEEKLFKLMKN